MFTNNTEFRYDWKNPGYIVKLDVGSVQNYTKPDLNNMADFKPTITNDNFIRIKKPKCIVDLSPNNNLLGARDNYNSIDAHLAYKPITDHNLIKANKVVYLQHPADNSFRYDLRKPHN